MLIKSHLQVPDLRRVVEEALELRKPTTGSGKADALGGATAEVYEGLGSEERRDFDALDDYRKVAVARVLAELQHKVRDVAWDAETDRRIHSALASFTRECVSSSNQGSFTSAVIEMTTLVEGLAKQLISRLTNAVYGGDPARIRRELNLPTSKFRNLTLGMTVQALRSASSHPEFTEYADLLTNQWIQRLESFTDSRNRWAHDDIHLQGLELLDEVHRVFAEALDLVIWLSRSAESVRQQPAEQEDDGLRDTIELRLSDRHDQRFSVFVSHAAEDAQIASRLAIGLQALGYDTWFDEWELLAGDSIIERVEAAITVTDVLLVLLSASSVSSRWMRRELSAGLVRQLAGKGVLVIPVLVENCEIPGLLADVELVDLSDNFEQGFLWLVEALTARRGQIMGSQ